MSTSSLCTARASGLRDDGQVPPPRSVIIDSVEFSSTGIVPNWPKRSLERDYLGSTILWDSVRDVDTSEAPPEVRLKDGRTAFLSAVLRDQLADAATVAGINQVQRPPVWYLLLEPFLDTETPRAANRAALNQLGFNKTEVRRIRSRLLTRMIALTVWTLEWEHYGQADAIDAYASRRWMPGIRYRRFRAWTDAIAERTEPTA